MDYYWMHSDNQDHQICYDGDDDDDDDHDVFYHYVLIHLIEHQQYQHRLNQNGDYNYIEEEEVVDPYNYHNFHNCYNNQDDHGGHGGHGGHGDDDGLRWRKESLNHDHCCSSYSYLVDNCNLTFLYIN